MGIDYQFNEKNVLNDDKKINYKKEIKPRDIKEDPAINDENKNGVDDSKEINNRDTKPNLKTKDSTKAGVKPE